MLMLVCLPNVPVNCVCEPSSEPSYACELYPSLIEGCGASNADGVGADELGVEADARSGGFDYCRQPPTRNHSPAS